MKVAIKLGLAPAAASATQNRVGVDENGEVAGLEAGPVLVRRLLKLFAPAILVGRERQQGNGFEVIPLDQLDAENTLVINLDVIDSTEVWGQLHAHAAEPKLMNFVWWSASQHYHHRVNKALLGLTFALFPTFANSERTASEIREIMRMWTTQPFVEQAKVEWSNLGVHLERVQPRRERDVPVVLYPAIYVDERKRPKDFIDVVERVAKRVPIKVEMRLHEKHLTREAAMRMSGQKWAWVGPLRSREDYWDALSQTTAFLATAPEESYGLEYVEAMIAGVIGVFPNRAWAKALVPPGYPFMYDTPAQAEALLLRAVTEPQACRAELDRLVPGSFTGWLRDMHDDDDFEDQLEATVRTWFGDWN